MKIAILAKYPDLYSHQRLLKAGEARGHTMCVLNPEQCYMNIFSQKPEVHYRGGEVIRDLDAIIPRISPRLTFYGTAVLRQFEMLGVYSLNSSVAITRSRDKLRSLQHLAVKGIPMPTTGFAHSPQDTEDLIRMVGGAPLVIKLLEGTQGTGIVLAETTQAARSVINAFKQLQADILVQEFIKEAGGSDLRCFVVGKKVIAAMQRTAKEGEFRANVHQGGSVSAVKITPQERKMAIEAAQAMGLQVAGVDLIRSARGPLVLEINSSPGLEGIEKASTVDIADLVIEHIEKNTKLKS